MIRGTCGAGALLTLWLSNPVPAANAQPFGGTCTAQQEEACACDQTGCSVCKSGAWVAQPSSFVCTAARIPQTPFLTIPLPFKLEQPQSIKINPSSEACTAAIEGTLRYQSGAIEFCNGSIWKDLAAPVAVSPPPTASRFVERVFEHLGHSLSTPSPISPGETNRVLCQATISTGKPGYVRVDAALSATLSGPGLVSVPVEIQRRSGGSGARLSNQRNVWLRGVDGETRTLNDLTWIAYDLAPAGTSIYAIVVRNVSPNFAGRIQFIANGCAMQLFATEYVGR
jgi:hypothetical protein